MTKLRKGLTISSIVLLVLTVGMLIGAIFGLQVFEGTLFKFLLTFAILCAGSTLYLNAVDIYSKRKILSIVDMAMLGILIVLGLIIVWAAIELFSTFGRITAILSLATILFNIIIANYLKLGKSQKVLQIITYSLIIVLDILLTIVICGVKLFDYNWFWQVFAVLCLVTFILLVTLSILSKKEKPEQVINVTHSVKDGYIEVEKTVYDALIAKVEKLENELEKLKSENKNSSENE